MQTDFVRTSKLVAIEDAERNFELIPDEPGVYAWFFRRPLPGIRCDDCLSRENAKLLYVGIAPRYRRVGADRTKRTLRVRLKYHLTGNLSGSTLRHSLAAILKEELNLQAQKRGTRITLASDEDRLNDWMRGNALLTWSTCANPWTLEHELMSAYVLPLNLMSNSRNSQRSHVSDLRSALSRTALPDPRSLATGSAA